ncbi:hypothetical protein [Actinoplanes sp. NPDC051411]|uniref:hypothetical protein n=1 Tax=Actinoplanes sp. NPDC051411 TaxID=3155522 RepID=UPI00342878E5
MPPPKPKASRAAVIVTIVAIVIVLTCLSFGTVVFFTLRHDDSLDQAGGAPATPPTAEPFPTDLPTGDPDRTYAAHEGDIRQFIVDRPDGVQAWEGAPSDQFLDLKTAAADFADPNDGKAVLQQYHFVDGYTRRWIDDDKNMVKVRVLRFASPSDGDNFTNFFIDANQGGSWGDPQPVPGIDTAAGFVEDKPMENGYQRSVAVGDAGDIVAIVIADQMPTADAAVPDAELLDEFDLL